MAISRRGPLKKVTLEDFSHPDLEAQYGLRDDDEAQPIVTPPPILSETHGPKSPPTRDEFRRLMERVEKLERSEHRLKMALNAMTNHTNKVIEGFNEIWSELEHKVDLR